MLMTFELDHGSTEKLAVSGIDAMLEFGAAKRCVVHVTRSSFVFQRRTIPLGTSNDRRISCTLGIILGTA